MWQLSRKEEYLEVGCLARFALDFRVSYPHHRSALTIRITRFGEVGLVWSKSRAPRLQVIPEFRILLVPFLAFELEQLTNDGS